MTWLLASPSHQHPWFWHSRINESFLSSMRKDFNYMCQKLYKMQIHIVMTSSNGSIFRVTGPFCGEFTGHRQWRRALMFSLICALNKRLIKQSCGWWFETPWRPLWCHCNVLCFLKTNSAQQGFNQLQASMHIGREPGVIFLKDGFVSLQAKTPHGISY